MSHEAWLRANPKPNHPYVQKYVHTDLKTKKKTTHISYEKPLPIIRERIMIQSSEYTSKLSTQIIIR